VTTPHPTLEQLAKLLAGKMEYDELVFEVLPHFLAQCDTCSGRVAEIRRLQAQVGHWDEMVAVFESREAPALVARLAGLPYEAQLAHAESEESLQGWCVCDLLLKKSLAAVCGEPQRSVDLATLAVRVAAHLDDRYDPEWVFDLRARAQAHLGNAHRVLGELRSAEEAFLQAESFLRRSLSGNEKVIAEVASFKASLRMAQRRFDEALELLDEVIAIYRNGHPEDRDLHLAGRALVKKAYTEIENSLPEKAIPLLREAEPLLDRERDPRLLLCLRHNLLDSLAKVGRSAEADVLMPEVRALCEEMGGDLDLVRLRWVEGKIDFGLGRLAAAEVAFREVQEAFLNRRLGYDAALVSLDLALLFASEHRNADLKQLAAEILPAFESREIHREAMAALLMFQGACEEERLTVELARQLADFLQRERRPAPFPAHS
jgi:tetratricopeptide (TPR) repeat protein